MASLKSNLETSGVQDFPSKHSPDSYALKLEKEIFSQKGYRLSDICQKLGYSSLNCKIMSLDETISANEQKLAIKQDKELLDFYIQKSKEKRFIARKGSNRSWTTYFKQLIAGWIEEDLFILFLKGNGINAQLNSSDSKRIIDIGNDISQNPDITVWISGSKRQIELSNEYNYFLERDGFIEKRCPALLKMWQEGSIWLYRDRKHKQYVLVDFASEKIKLHLRHHNTVNKDWAKDVHRYILEENGKKIRQDSNLIQELTTILNSDINVSAQRPPIEEVVDKDSPPTEYDIGGVSRRQKMWKEKDEAPAENPSKPLVAAVPVEQEETVKPKPQPRLAASISPSSKPITQAVELPPQEPPTDAPTDDSIPHNTEEVDSGESDIDGEWDSFQVDDGGFV